MEILRDTQIPKEIQTAFIWQSQSFGNPEIIEETMRMMRSLKLEDHQFFKVLKPLLNIPTLLRVPLTKIASSITGGYSKYRANIVIYKYNENHLSSLQEFSAGHKTYQEVPYGALISDLPVFTYTGEEIIENQAPSDTRSHLPNLKQSKNVLLILYSYSTIISLIDKKEWLSVRLFWPSQLGKGTSIVTSKGVWLLGERGNSYIAVFCFGKKSREQMLVNDEKSQMWAIVLGHKEIHNSFANFTETIRKAKVNFQVIDRLLIVAQERKLYGSVEVDGEVVDLTWELNGELIFNLFFIAMIFASFVFILVPTIVGENVFLALVLGFNYFKQNN